MLFGNRQVTEPSYAGLRVPRLYSGDDTPLMRQVSPQEKYRQLDDLKVGHDAGHATGGEYQEVAQDSGRNARLQGAVRGIGSDIARLFAQDDQRQPMSLPPVQMGDITPLIDPRWLPRRAMGGPVKKNKPYLINENGREAFQDDATGEVSLIDTEGPAIFTPDEKGKIIPLQPGIQAQLKDILGEPPVEESPTEEVPTTAPTTAPTKEPSVADLLRTKIDDTQRRLAEGATKNPDGTTTYGGKQYRKRNYKDVLKSAGLGVLQSLASAPPTNDLGALLGRAIGGGAAGGVMGATMNNADEKMADRMKLAQILPQYQQAYGMERQKKADDLQIENTRADNAINKLRIESALQSKADAEKGKAVLALNKLRWFDPKNPTHAALAKRSGLDPEDLQGWDDRRPYTKNVAGVEYIYKDGAFTPSNLPVDEAKTLKDYTVEMPNGEKRTYKVSQKDAANFSTQMSALGARLAQSQSQFDATMNFRKEEGEKNRQLRVQLQQNAQQYGKEKTVQMYADGFKRWYQKENGRAPTQTEIDEYLKGYILPQFEGAEGEFIPN